MTLQLTLKSCSLKYQVALLFLGTITETTVSRLLSLCIRPLKTTQLLNQFDTLDAETIPAQVNRFNQFEYQLFQDDNVFIESDTTETIGNRIANNGLTINTDIRYNMAGGNNGTYSRSYLDPPGKWQSG